MWKLTVERKYEHVGTTATFENTDRMYLESESLGELTSVIAGIDKLGSKGEYEYKLVNGKDGVKNEA